MGFWDFLKKFVAQNTTTEQTAAKDDERVKITFTETVNTESQYDPWEQQPLPRNENYATAAMLRCCLGGRAMGKDADEYPRYLNYRFKIHDPIKYQKRLIEDGYLIEGSPNIVLRCYKVVELKSILNANNLLDKGKKDELIQRICANVNLETLNLEKLYVPSNKGIEHLKKYDFVFGLSDFEISTDQYDAFAKSYPEYMKPNDIIWKMLNDRYNSYNLSQDYGLARNELYYMACFLIKENKFTDALYRLILVLYYDTRGNSIEDVTIAPGIVDLIFKYKDYFTKEMVQRCYQRYALPHHCLKEQDFTRLLADIFEDNQIDKTKYFK